jgi:cell division protein FtsQ
MGGFLALVAAVAAIVLSPLMALEKIEVVGLVSLDESVVVGAVADQRGRPLALLDFDDVRSKLGTVPQIESFATELRPPHTLVIRVVERVAVGSIRVATGYDVVDAAGVVIAFSEGEPAGIPAIFTADAAGPGFDAIVATLSALPTDVRADVKSISAESRDSVTFLLRSAAHEIRWGSDESASQKSAVLRQALVVAAVPGAGPSASLTAWERRAHGWVMVLPAMPSVLGRTGIVAGAQKREGDGGTPAGVHRLERAFGYAPTAATALDYRQATARDWWIDEPKDPAYNTWVKNDGVPAVSAEAMRRHDGQYELGAVLGWNTDPVVPGRGSAIFFHVWNGPDEATSGCVAAARDDVQRVLAWLDRARQPVMVVAAP